MQKREKTKENKRGENWKRKKKQSITNKKSKTKENKWKKQQHSSDQTEWTNTLPRNTLLAGPYTKTTQQRSDQTNEYTTEKYITGPAHTHGRYGALQALWARYGGCCYTSLLARLREASPEGRREIGQPSRAGGHSLTFFHFIFAFFFNFVYTFKYFK